MKLLLSILPLLLVIGCAPKVKPSTVLDTGNAIERAKAHNESQGKLIAKAMPHADGTGKEFLAVAIEENAAVNKATNDAATELKGVSKELGDTKDELNRWYYSTGAKVQRAIVKLLWIAGGTWFVLGILGAWMAPHWIGRTILNVLPLSNIFAEFARRK